MRHNGNTMYLICELINEVVGGWKGNKNEFLSREVKKNGDAICWDGGIQEQKPVYWSLCLGRNNRYSLRQPQ